MTSEDPLSGILFDQRSRYEALATGVRALVPDTGTVLDVGCGQSMLLGAFLPDHHVTYLDPLLGPRHGEVSENGAIIGRAFDQVSVPDDAFDVVVCVDVLEHIPAESRREFLAEMMRASRVGIVIAAPFADVGDAQATDDTVHLAYHQKHGRDYSWLEEHEKYGLPIQEDAIRQLRDAGYATASFGNGHTPWLKDLLALHIVLLDRREHLPLLREIGDRFATELLRFDNLQPTYRQVLIASPNRDITLAATAPDDSAEADAKAAWHRFRTWADARLATHADELVEQTSGALGQLEDARQKLDLARADLSDAREKLAPVTNELRKTRRALVGAQQDLVVVRRSYSWRLTAPLRLVGRLTTRAAGLPRRLLLAIAAGAAASPLPQSWRWPLKRVFFGLFGRLLQNTGAYADYQAARRWRQQPSTPTPTPLQIEPPHARLPDVLVFGVIDWQLRIQRPQHLAAAFARAGHRTFYLSPGFRVADRPGYDLEVVHAEPTVYQVHLHAPEDVCIYSDAPESIASDFLLAGLRRLFGDIGLSCNLAKVDHPGWVDVVRTVPRSIRVYDCMDNHSGFEDSGSELQRAEERLIAGCDLVVATSNHIAADVRGRHDRISLIRNACAPDDFATARRIAAGPRPVIGYFGAIAQWFDTELLRDLAEQMQDCDFLLVGDDSAGVADRLRGLANVQFVGEVGYAELPEHLRAMDVLLIPFRINKLTLATNPVKAYEALAAGKPVVATRMPELIETDVAPFVLTGGDADELVPALREALASAHDADRQQQRIAFAQQQTWQQRAADLLRAVAGIPRPRVAVVVVSWNGVDLTSRCVRSVLDDPLAADVDVIVVDNDSQDDTPRWLDEIERHARVRVVRNDENRGFAAACNQGLAAGAERSPDLLVILNNDLVVTPGWALTLHRHLRQNPDIGLIGPVTNNIGNEARVTTRYDDIDGMQAEQRALTGAAAGRTFDIPVLAFFCVAMPTDVYRQVGGLDENFGTGFFEDDDYCQRVRGLGRRIACAEDVFIHHELSASFDRIDQTERQRLFDKNRAYYESKWGPWQRHEYRARNSG